MPSSIRTTLEFITECRGVELQPTMRDDLTRGPAIYRREDDVEVVDCIMLDITRLDAAENPFS